MVSSVQGVCLTECQAQIPMKFRKGLLAKTAKKVKTAVPEDARTEDAADTEEAKTEEGEHRLRDEQSNESGDVSYYL